MPARFVLNVSRRAVLKRAAGLAAASGLSAVPGFGVLLAGGESSPEGADKPPAATEPLVVYVADPSKGEVIFMVGTKEVVRRDPRLVSRLLTAMGDAQA